MKKWETKQNNVVSAVKCATLSIIQCHRPRLHYTKYLNEDKLIDLNQKPIVATLKSCCFLLKKLRI